jgi:3-hydroxyisobutyrate dehydrogenase-like beta-hydroxyacid dehydrogenase
VRIGILHPGAMGSYMGEALSSAHDVLWTGIGRSYATAQRAATAGLTETDGPTELVRQSDIVISVCPPHAAIEVAEEVSKVRSGGFLYVDANSVAPRTVSHIAQLFRNNTVVDATLTGAPRADNATLWVSGPGSSELSAIFTGTRINCRIIGPDIGQASAFKICAGLRSKVLPALWATLIEAASAYGTDVETSLHAHLSDLGYDIDNEAAKVAQRAPKAWRWTGEMEEAAKAMDDIALPTGFSEAAAMTYRRIASQRAS